MRSGRKRKSSRAGRKSDRPPQNEPNQEEEQAQAQEEQENVDNEQNNEVEEEDDQTEEEEDPEDNEVTANFDGFSVGTSSPTFYAFPGQRNAGKIIDSLILIKLDALIPISDKTCHLGLLLNFLIL